MNSEEQKQLPQRTVTIKQKIRQRLEGLLGAATAFSLLQVDSDVPQAEIHAAKETGKQIQNEITDILREYFQ